MHAFTSKIGWQNNKGYIKTQYCIGKQNNENRADIVIIDRYFEDMLIIESKINADFSENQISGYLSLIKENPNSKVISITKYNPDYIENYRDSLINLQKSQFTHLLWSDIYKIIKKTIQEKDGAKNMFLLKETMKYMEAEKMADFNGFEDSDMAIWSDYMDFYDRLGEYFDQLEPILKKRGYKVKDLDSEAEMHRGFEIIPESEKIRQDEKSVWLGIWNIDLEEENVFRLYCGVQVYSKTLGDDINKKIPIFQKPRIKNQYRGVMLTKPLMSLIGDKVKDKHLETLNKFFLDGIDILEKNKIWEILLK